LFSAREHIALCGNCARIGASSGETSSDFIHINLGCQRWLAAVQRLEPSELHRYSLDNKSFNEAKALVTAVMAGALGKRLASWDW